MIRWERRVPTWVSALVITAMIGGMYAYTFWRIS